MSPWKKGSDKHSWSLHASTHPSKAKSISTIERTNSFLLFRRQRFLLLDLKVRQRKNMKFSNAAILLAMAGASQGFTVVHPSSRMVPLFMSEQSSVSTSQEQQVPAAPMPAGELATSSDPQFMEPVTLPSVAPTSNSMQPEWEKYPSPLSGQWNKNEQPAGKGGTYGEAVNQFTAPRIEKALEIVASGQTYKPQSTGAPTITWTEVNPPDQPKVLSAAWNKAERGATGVQGGPTNIWQAPKIAKARATVGTYKPPSTGAPTIVGTEVNPPDQPQVLSASWNKAERGATGAHGGPVNVWLEPKIAKAQGTVGTYKPPSTGAPTITWTEVNPPAQPKVLSAAWNKAERGLTGHHGGPPNQWLKEKIEKARAVQGYQPKSTGAPTIVGTEIHPPAQPKPLSVAWDKGY